MNVKYVYLWRYKNERLKINVTYPLRYENFKLIYSKQNKRKMLNLITLKCINYPLIWKNSLRYVFDFYIISDGAIFYGEWNNGLLMEMDI